MKYPHLDPRISSLADAPAGERIAYILEDKYVPYARAEYIISEVLWMYKQSPSRRAKCALVYGEPGYGKSMIINEAHRRAEEDNCVEGSRDRHSISISMAGSPELRIMFSRILRALDSPYSIDDRPSSLYEQACLSLKAAKTKVLLIDELHNLLLTRSHLEEAMAVVRDLANLPISLVCSGTDAVRTCVETDDQLRDRFRSHHLRAWVESTETRNFVATLEARLPLREPSNLAGKDALPLLLEMSGGHPSTLVTGVREAGRDALLAGEERITLDGLAGSLKRILAEKFEAADAHRA